MATVTLTEADAGRTVPVAPGEPMVVRLAENPTTGYRWSIPMGLEVAADTYERGSEAGSPRVAGAGGQRVLTLIAPAQPTRAEFRLQRPHGGDTAKTFTVTLQPRTR